MDIFTLDYESFFGPGYSLRTHTTSEYVFAPEWETIGVGVRWPDGYMKWMEHEEFASDTTLHADIRRSALLCHHSHFDGRVLAHHYDVRPRLWLDTLSMARALYRMDVGGSLGKLAAKFGLGVKGDDTKWAFGKRRADFTPEQWAQYGRYCLNDVQLTWDLFWTLMADFPARELAVIDQVVRAFTEPVVVLDEARMAAYHQEEVAQKKAALSVLQGEANARWPEELGTPLRPITRRTIMSNDQLAELLMDLGVDPPKKWSKKKGRDDWAFAKKDAEFEALKDHEDPLVQLVVETRLGLKSTINETRSARFLRLGAGGRPMPVYLKYSGAHTHRLSGGDKMNWQNLERTDKNNPKKGVIRRCIQAPRGHLLVSMDSGQIEARGTAWLTEQDDLVAAFTNGEDVYCSFASTAYRRPITKADEKERSAGKVCVLGLGYGMGGAKLAVEMLKGPMGASPVRFTREDAATMGVDVTDYLKRMGGTEEMIRQKIFSILPFEELLPHAAVCDYLVRTYRKKNHKIANFWWRVAPEIINAMAEGLEIPLGPLVTGKNCIRLPSGLKLDYPDLTVGEAGASYFNGKHRVALHGSLLTENIIQAVCRDIVVNDQMLQVADLGYKVVTTTHDEIALCVRESEAEEALKVLYRIMTTAPAWAPGLPLAAEGGIGPVYGDIVKGKVKL